VEIVDLSVAFAEGMPRYPADWFPRFGVREVEADDASRRFTALDLFAHNGTHVESPCHVLEGDATIDELPLAHFAGYPVVVDLGDVPDATEISVELLRERLPEQQPGRAILLVTGYNDRRWGEPDFWFSSPWLAQDAAAYVASLGPALVGFDFQTERPGDSGFPVHRVLARAGVALCEYLFNLGEVDSRTLFLALPIKVEGVEAAPTRAVGVKGL
jgi:kynurenine formamidase